jgi:alanyl-tRNA synthetase
LAAQAVEIGGFKFLAARVEGVEPKALRDMVDQLKADLVDAAVLLAGAKDGKVNLIAGVSGSALGKVKAGDLLGEVARQIGGKGGGRPDMAQGGGDDVPQLPVVLAAARDWVAAKL